MPMPAVRYLVQNVDDSVAFSTEHLGFTLEERWGPAFAIVSLEGLRLWLAGPESSAARPMADGRKTETALPSRWKTSNRLG
jgi:catechol 2,3-dioxygenase-like lactoylglutathione lyase family enzyme